MRTLSSTRLLLLVGSPILAIAAAILSGIANPYYVFVVDLVLVNAIAATGLIILSGIGGMLSLGTAALLALGAYGTALLMTQFGLGFVGAALCGAVLTMGMGLLLAAPALRLGGLHLAIVTLAFGIVIVQLISHGGTLTGGVDGITLPDVTILGLAIDDDRSKFFVIAPVFLVTVLTAANFAALKPGRALLALREREVMARALGVDTSLYKVIAFAYSSLLAGIAGSLFILLKGFVSVDDFTITQSIYFFVMIVIGGMWSILGGVLGAAFVTVLPELLSQLKNSADAVFGIVMLLVIILLPDGLVSLGQMARALRPPVRRSTRP